MRDLRPRRERGHEKSAVSRAGARQPEEGLTILDLKPGNTVTLAELRQIIKNNGFVSKEASALARGSAVDSNTFVVSGTNERLLLSSPPQSTGDDWRIAVRSPR